MSAYQPDGAIYTDCILSNTPPGSESNFRFLIYIEFGTCLAQAITHHVIVIFLYNTSCTSNTVIGAISVSNRGLEKSQYAFEC